MTEQWSVPVWALVATTVAVLLLGLLAAAALVAVGRARRRAAADLDAVRRSAEELVARVEDVEHRLARQQRRESLDAHEYVITHVGEEPEAPSAAEDGQDAQDAPTVPAPLFADLVLRESAVQAASLAHGLRRALAPETRHRIRFEMRREVKRARKQRRADLRAARREWQARGRADQAEPAA
ncbi:type II secretory pathway pseudopilin PulG [Nocardioides salarius]|uniref:Type II secretory pathway pseudopilin PulG n=1 Tax=Nocardioides salarius TaxID=374513 RepID=A0ABS2M5P9_9ACTN|nr:hypothetical protein [Nocardioides salarius]MBM7506495.1 type II secretory pathway pseudopilin PulG [Nocardioides salarius]